MPWFKHPIRLLESDEVRHLSHMLRAAGDPSPEDAARSVVGLLWELAARSPTPGTISTPDPVVECALRKPGSVPLLVDAGLAVRDGAGLRVALFAEWNDRQIAKSASDRERRREERKGVRQPPGSRDGRETVEGPSKDRPATVEGPSREGRGSDADADADDEDEPEMSKGGPSTTLRLIDETIADSERIPLASATTDAARALIEKWNAFATELKLPRCAKLNPDLRAKLNARIKDDNLLVRFDALAAAIRGSKFYLGDNDRRWRADPQWLARPGAAAKLMAQYEVAGPQTAAQARAAMSTEAVASYHADAMRKQAAARQADDDERERIRREEAETRARVLRLPQAQRDALKAEILRGWPPLLAKNEPPDGYSRSMIAEMARRAR